MLRIVHVFFLALEERLTAATLSALLRMLDLLLMSGLIEVNDREDESLRGELTQVTRLSSL